MPIWANQSRRSDQRKAITSMAWPARRLKPVNWSKMIQPHRGPGLAMQQLNENGSFWECGADMNRPSMAHLLDTSYPCLMALRVQSYPSNPSMVLFGWWKMSSSNSFHCGNWQLLHFIFMEMTLKVNAHHDSIGVCKCQMRGWTGNFSEKAGMSQKLEGVLSISMGLSFLRKLCRVAWLELCGNTCISRSK